MGPLSLGRPVHCSVDAISSFSGNDRGTLLHPLFAGWGTCLAGLKATNRGHTYKICDPGQLRTFVPSFPYLYIADEIVPAPRSCCGSLTGLIAHADISAACQARSKVYLLAVITWWMLQGQILPVAQPCILGSPWAVILPVGPALEVTGWWLWLKEKVERLCVHMFFCCETRTQRQYPHSWRSPTLSLKVLDSDKAYLLFEKWVKIFP